MFKFAEKMVEDRISAGSQDSCIGGESMDWHIHAADRQK